jgi:hypothetical protein
MFIFSGPDDYIHLFHQLLPVMVKLEKQLSSSNSIDNVRAEALRRMDLLTARGVEIPLGWTVPSPEKLRDLDENRARKDKSHDNGGGERVVKHSPHGSWAGHARQESWNSSVSFSHNTNTHRNNAHHNSHHNNYATAAGPSQNHHAEAGASRNGSSRESPRFFHGNETSNGGGFHAAVPRGPANDVPPLAIPRGPAASANASAGPNSATSTGSVNGLGKSHWGPGMGVVRK